MRVLVISAFHEKIVASFAKTGDQVFIWDNKDFVVSVEFLRKMSIDCVIVFAYSKILPSSVIKYCPVINLHASYLPWGKGPSPVLWTWLADEPKGVTVHYMDEGIDTGDIIAQKEIDLLSEEMTLDQIFSITVDSMATFFDEVWVTIRNKTNTRVKQAGPGSSHTFRDQSVFQDILEAGLNIPIRELRAAIQHRLKSK